MLKKMFFVLIALCWSMPAFGAHPLITDDAGTQGKVRFQLEVNGEYGHKNNDNVVEDCTEMAAALTYGINDHLDVNVSFPYRLIRREDSGTTTENGISDTALALKWRFYEKNGLSFAVKPGVTLPSGNDERCLGSGRVTYSMFFITTKEVAPCAIHLNFGYKRNNNKIEERDDLWHASLAGEIKIRNLKIVANVGMERNSDKCSCIDPSFILAGMIYSIRENLDVDFGFKSCLNKLGTHYSALAGLTLRF